MPMDVLPGDMRLFKRQDSDFPTTRAAQERLVAAGRVEGEGPLAQNGARGMPGHTARTSTGRNRMRSLCGRLPPPTPAAVPLGETDAGTLHLDLPLLLAGRLLIQGSSGAGKSATLRHLVEEAQDFTTIFIVDPEGEFGNLSEHIGASTVRASETTTDGLTAAALRARHHRLHLHLDLSELEPDLRILRAAAFFAGLIASPQEDWAHTVLVCIDESHLLAPHVAASARDAETRRIGVATLTDLCARGRKRGVSPVLSTQRLAKLASSVVSELQNALIGRNVFDRDIARASDLLGFGAERAAALRDLAPGEFFALGPALCPAPLVVKVAPSVTRNMGATPDLVSAADVTPEEARTLLDLGALREVPRTGPAPAAQKAGTRALDGFLLDPNAPTAARVAEALRNISPNAATATDIARHLGLGEEAVHAALDLLASTGAVDTAPRGDARIARLSARLRLRASADTPVVGLA